MSAPNFALTNASQIFAFGGNRYFDQETIDANDYPQEWLGTFDELRTQDEYDFTVKCCQASLQRLGWDETEEWNFDRNYPTNYFAERVKAVEIAGITAYISIKAGATAAYYEGANFDWFASLEVRAVYDGYEFTTYEYDLTGRYAVSTEHVVKDEWLENKGLCRMQAKNIIRRIYATFAELVSECEKVFAETCDRRLSCIGTFGNGEAIYCDLYTERGRLKAACR